MDVTELGDFHAIESRRKIGDRNVNTMDLIVQPFGSKSVHDAEEGRSAGSSGGGLKKIAAAGIDRRGVLVRILACMVRLMCCTGLLSIGLKKVP